MALKSQIFKQSLKGKKPEKHKNNDKIVDLPFIPVKDQGFNQQKQTDNDLELGIYPKKSMVSSIYSSPKLLQAQAQVEAQQQYYDLGENGSSNSSNQKYFNNFDLKNNKDNNNNQFPPSYDDGNFYSKINFNDMDDVPLNNCKISQDIGGMDISNKKNISFSIKNYQNSDNNDMINKNKNNNNSDNNNLATSTIATTPINIGINEIIPNNNNNQFKMRFVKMCQRGNFATSIMIHSYLVSMIIIIWCSIGILLLFGGDFDSVIDSSTKILNVNDIIESIIYTGVLFFVFMLIILLDSYF